jgi:hypothetical protein
LIVEGSFQNAYQSQNPALTIKNPWPKTKAQREKRSGFQEETMNARQRRAGTANQTKPQC